MKITLALVVDALHHCSNQQEEDFLKYLNEGHGAWGGWELKDIIDAHIESIEEDEESDRKFEADFQNPSIDAVHSDRLRGEK